MQFNKNAAGYRKLRQPEMGKSAQDILPKKSD